MVGCNESPNLAKVKPQSKANLTNEPVCYGRNVYYFPLTQYRNAEVRFGILLANFLNKHNDLEVSAMASDDNMGHAIGYFVTFRNKK